MAEKESFDDVGVPINATITGGGTVTSADFIFTLRQGGTSTEQAPDTKPVTGNTASSTTFGPTAVAAANDFYEVSYKVKITPDGQTNATTLEGADTLKIWAKTIKVKFTSVNGEDHKNAKFRVMRNTTKLIEPSTNSSGEWEGDLPSFGAWTVEVAAPWEKKADTTATGRSREFVVAKQPSEATFLKPDPDHPTQKMKQYVNQDVPSTGWAKATPYGHQLAFKVGTKGNLGTTGTIVNIKCEFGRESARDTPKPALLATGLTGAPTESGKTFTGAIALGTDKTATFTLELGYAGGDTVKVSVGTTAACEDAALTIENWRKLEYENWMPDQSELSDFTAFSGTTAALSANSRAYLKEVLDQVFIEWNHKAGDFYDKNDLADLEKNVYPGSIYGASDTDKVLVLTLDQIEQILNARALHQADNRVVSMIWCDTLVDEVKAWNQTFKDIEGETPDLVPTDGLQYFPDKPADINGDCGGEFALERITWRVTHWQDGSDWKPVTADTDPGGVYRAVATARTFTARSDIEAHIVLKTTTNITIKLPAGTSPGNAGYPGHCLSLSSGGKLQATGLTASARPTVEFATDVVVARSTNLDLATILVKEVNQNKTFTFTFLKPTSTSEVGTDVTPSQQANLDTWIQSELCGLPELTTSGNKLKFEISGPNDNARRLARVANVKTALTARTAAVAPQQAFPTPAKPVRIEFLLQGSAADCGTNGAAAGGDIWMCTFNGTVDPIGMASVLLHKLGHNMGQAYANDVVGLDTSDNVNFGRPATGKIPGIEFPAGVPAGDIYSGKGHRGTHCAHGVSATDKGKPDYGGDTPVTGDDCLMFGAADMTSATKIYFCDNCKTYIRAENLTDIRKNWSA